MRALRSNCPRRDHVPDYDQGGCLTCRDELRAQIQNDPDQVDADLRAVGLVP